MAGQGAQFRDQVVLFKDGETRVLLWIQQDPQAIRCGLAVRGMDLHYSGYKCGGVPHLTGKSRDGVEPPDVIPIGPLQLSPNPTVAELLCSFMFLSIDDDWSKFQPFESGRAANVFLLDRASLPSSFNVRVDVADLRNFFPSYSEFDTARLILLDTCAEPLIALSVHDLGDR